MTKYGFGIQMVYIFNVYNTQFTVLLFTTRSLHKNYFRVLLNLVNILMLVKIMPDPLYFMNCWRMTLLQARCPSCHGTNRVKTLKDSLTGSFHISKQNLQNEHKCKLLFDNYCNEVM